MSVSVLRPMVFASPSKTVFTVYTKSNCPFCTKVKDLLEPWECETVLCDDYLQNVSMKESFLRFIKFLAGGKDHRTFPMVFFQGNFIGGFTETKQYIELETAFDEF